MQISDWVRRSRSLVTTGLTELYSGNPGKVDDVVIVKLGKNWGSQQGETYIGTITYVTPGVIRVKFFDDQTPDLNTPSLSISWYNSSRSEVFLWPQTVTKVQPAEQPEPDDVTQPAKTLFTLMCEYDAALATLQALKPGYDAARDKFHAAKAALGMALASHKDL